MEVFYITFFSAGFILSEVITRLLNIQVTLELKIRHRILRARIHHAYIGIIAFLSLLYNYVIFSYFLLGIMAHDLFLELKKIIRR